MKYEWTAIPESAIPSAANPLFQHMLETYVSESNKVALTWKQFTDADLGYKPHPRSSSVGEILRHQLLSERRFFGEFLGIPEPAPDKILPKPLTVESAIERFVVLTKARLGFLATWPEDWWMKTVPFFDVERQRIWIFWRRVPHTSHHRTQPHSFSSTAGSRRARHVRAHCGRDVDGRRSDELGDCCGKAIAVGTFRLRLFFPLHARYAL
jgi:hypothetical protein